jgi:tellurium resistance protein TerD
MEDIKMGINLQKGQKISLEKEAPGLSKIIVGLGWDVSKGGGNIDLDSSCLMLNENLKLEKLIYFGDKTSADGSVVHSGDNLTGAGDGDDEQIQVDLSKVPQNIKKLVFTINVYEGKSRKQHFGMINNAFVRVVNAANNQEIAKYNLSESYPDMTSMLLAEVYRHNDEWKMSALGDGLAIDKIADLAARYR